VSCTGKNREPLLGLEYFLNQRGTRPSAKHVRGRGDVRDRASDCLQSLAPMLEQIAFAIGRDMAAGWRRHPWQDVDDLDPRTASSGERYRLVECCVVRRGRVDVDQDAGH
jgi:hypothetical protein